MEHFGLGMFTCTKFWGVAHLKLLEKRRRDVTLSGERSNHAPGTDFEDRCAGQHRSCEAHVLRSDARLHGFSADILGKKYTQWRREIMDLTSAPIFVESSSNLQVCSYVSGTHLFKSFLAQGETQST